MLTEVLTPEAHELARVHDLIARFPNLSETERQRIFYAIESAPQGRAGWLAARYIDLAGGTTLRPYPWALAVRWAVTPTREQMIAGLNYAAGTLT